MSPGTRESGEHPAAGRIEGGPGEILPDGAASFSRG
jgi:hypothetical protein